MDNYIKSLKDTIELCNIIIGNTDKGGITREQGQQAEKIKARTLAEINQAYKETQQTIDTQGDKPTGAQLQSLREWETIILNIESLEPPEGTKNTNN